MTVLWVAGIACIGVVVLLAVGRAVAVSRLQRQFRAIGLDDGHELAVPLIDHRRLGIFDPSGSLNTQHREEAR